MSSRASHSERYGDLRLVKRADNGVWYVRYRPIDAPRFVEKSLHTNFKDDAIRKARAFNTQLVNKTLNIADGTIALSAMFDKFFEAKLNHYRPESLKRYQSCAHVLMRWMTKHHPEIVQARHFKRPELVREFQSFRLSKGKSRRTIDADIRNLHTIWNWAKQEGLVDYSPFNYSTGNVDLFDEPDCPADTYTEEEYVALLAEAKKRKDPLVHDLILVLAETGMRYGEAQNMRGSWLHWEGKPYIEIRKTQHWQPKHDKEVKWVPMSAAVQEILKRRQARHKDGLLFRNSAGQKTRGDKTREALQKMFPKVNIDSTTRRLHWHSFRAFFVRKCVRKGIPINAIMRMTGHDTIGLVLHYADADKAAVLNETDKLFAACGNLAEVTLSQ